MYTTELCTISNYRDNDIMGREIFFRDGIDVRDETYDNPDGGVPARGSLLREHTGSSSAIPPSYMLPRR